VLAKGIKVESTGEEVKVVPEGKISSKTRGKNSEMEAPKQKSSR